MRVHLIHAHPEPRSFVAAMRHAIVEELVGRGDEVTVSDLHAMRFNPVLSAADFTDPQRTDHLTYALEQRHAYQHGTLAPDIAREVELVLSADAIGFTFPIFWFGTPAILKGWVERVFLAGAFYGGKRVYGRGGLAGKRAFAAISLGGRAHMFGPGAIHGELETGMMRHFFQGTLGYVGLSVHRSYVAYHTPYVDAACRREMLEELRHYVRTLEAQPTFTFPDLDAYDDRFAPKPAAE